MHLPLIRLRPLIPIALVVAGVALAGCAHVSGIRVDAIGSIAQTSGTTFAVVPAPSLVPTDTVFKQAADLTRSRLGAIGMMEISDPALADTLVEVGYDISLPRTNVRTERAPSVRLPDEEADTASLDPMDARPWKGRNQRAQEPPRLETRVIVTYAKSVMLVGVENHSKSGAGRTELWRVSASVVDSEPALARSLPGLVDAAVREVARTMTDTETTPTPAAYVGSVNVRR